MLKHFYNFKGLAILNDTQVSELVQLFATIITAVKKNREERMQVFEEKKSKFTEEDIELIKEDVKKVDRIWSHIMEMCTVLHRTMPA